MQGTLSSSRQIDTEKVKLQGITLLTTRFILIKLFDKMKGFSCQILVLKRSRRNAAESHIYASFQESFNVFVTHKLNFLFVQQCLIPVQFLALRKFSRDQLNVTNS